MPFTVIHGSFHLVGRTRGGKDTGFEPDGDSMQFKPDNPKLLDRLQKERKHLSALLDRLDAAALRGHRRA
jgi:hypothetical protein